MSTLVTSTDPIVHIIDGKAMADSRELADVFGKRHGDVLRAIDNLLENPARSM